MVKGRRKRGVPDSTPAYRLKDIRAEIAEGRPMPATRTALTDAVQLDYTPSEVRLIVLAIEHRHFVKSMPCDDNPTVRQDVYVCEDRGLPLYIKFQRKPNGGLMLVSFHKA
jgi:hypothetical protein